ncbi:2-oxo acid dehydrogenase subunit E2 [Spiroplasma monobiae]|uniref:Pyruvate dehydrogenase E2 component (Dihydrolipoamide acetyltransferase) n=1 Tax=Spiroplasma monobiae MQ-1 TaxID=1336748 RepID=A0A2K9LVA7_SPISQ|nr:2-oxo acid dehydrogenase subunit E2 [Spiroplasma monobiae]AUM62956.1 pyruvate dehydrogenase E2 component (dihydrolipoamide acetyltransferase) [Spiroplasma monobiae MQ-1]
MVHLRARNLPSKGILKEWLFSGEEITFGEDFALIELDDGSKVNIKSNYNGVVTKTIQLNSPVKNGSILANVAVGDKEIQKFKSRHFKKGDIEKIPEEEVFIADGEYEPKLKPVETDADSFSGAVVYDRYNQAVTPFSTGRDDIVDSPEKLKVLEERDKNMSQANEQPKDRFAQMRANIRDSIKNAPQNKIMGDLTKEELLKMADEKPSAADGGNLFSTNNVSGVSKFRQLVQARKEKLLVENDFKEVQEADEEINAMSKTDEKGRPLIMRNIIQSRIEKLNNSGGDPSVLERDIVATKDNAVLDSQRPKQIVDPALKAQEDERMKQKNLEVKTDETFLRQGASEDGQFGVSYGAYVEDEEATTIDANDLNPYGGTVMPKKKPKELMDEIGSKKNKTYAESKLSNLYDTSRRWDIMKSRDERSVINQRREAVERGLKQESLEYSKKIQEIGIPKEFLREVPQQDPNTGAMVFVPYNQTPKGKQEFENWLRATNLYTAYKDEEEFIERTQELGGTKEEIQAMANSSLLSKTPKGVQKELKSEINKKDSELEKASDKKTADETVDFLKEQIKELQKSLKEQNQLNAATSRLNQQSNFNAGTDTFSQMMQYMLMQNMMQNMNTKKDSNNQVSANDLKSIIKEEINTFAEGLKEKQRQEDERIRLEQEIIERVEKDIREKLELEKLEREQENIKDVNFEKDKPDNSVGYLQFESNDENKVVQREKVNQNRNSAVKSMILSQNFIPPLTISTEIDMSSILKLKHMLKQTQNHIKFTTISFIAKAISIALEEYPKLNSSYDAETNELVIKKYHNIGLATETSEGLIIPVLKFVEKLSIKEVAIDIKEVTTRLRAGELYNYEADGSTITIANYGNIGAIQATPTIFYPNAAVIGVGKVVKKPVVVDNEKLAIKAIMNMSLTVDQRIIDAAEAGQFLAKVKSILEKPEILTVS